MRDTRDSADEVARDEAEFADLLTHFARSFADVPDADVARVICLAVRAATGPTGQHPARTEVIRAVASALLVERRRFEAATALASQLQSALDSRIVIEQAKGILAERGGRSVADAFSELRGTSRRQRRPLRDVAAEVVAGVGE